jgi:hypothetical protein
MKCNLLENNTDCIATAPVPRVPTAVTSHPQAGDNSLINAIHLIPVCGISNTSYTTVPNPVEKLGLHQLCLLLSSNLHCMLAISDILLMELLDHAM